MLDILSRIARIGSRILRAATVVLASLMIVFAGYAVLDTYYLERSAFSDWDLAQYRPVDSNGNISRLTFEQLQAINPDVIGWITIYGTHIDYPIVQGPDDLYYINRNVYGDSSLSGAIYLQSANDPSMSDSYNLIYGHHFENGAMFGDLAKYLDEDFMEEHRQGEIITKDEIYYLDIIACVQTTAYDPSIFNVTSTSDPQIEDLLTSSDHKYVRLAPGFEEDHDGELPSHVSVGGSIIALSTCDDAETDGRDVVIAEISDKGPSRVPSDTTPDSDEASQVDAAAEDGGRRDAPGSSSRVPRTGESLSDRWAILNLIALLLTICCFVPFFIRYLSNKSDKSKVLVGTLLTFALTVAAAIVFILTENLRSPITLRDNWTPLMILFFAVALLITSFAERRQTRS